MALGQQSTQGDGASDFSDVSIANRVVVLRSQGHKMFLSLLREGKRLVW